MPPAGAWTTGACELIVNGRMVRDRTIAAAVTPRTKAVIPVHLYGQPANMDPILEIAKRHGLVVIEDACQAHGAEYKGRRTGTMGHMACFSFYPGKNLGGCGEGGMVVTDDPALARTVRMLRDWGAEKKYEHVLKGYNFRMEGIQGAVLRVKLRHLEAWTEARRAAAGHYGELLDAIGIGKHFNDRRLAELIRNSHWNLHSGSMWSDSFARRWIESLKDKPLYSARGVPLWYSPMIAALSSEKIPKEASPEEWIRILENKLSVPYTDLSDKRQKAMGTGEIRMEEIKWTGVFEWLANLDAHSLLRDAPNTKLTPKMVDPALHPWLEKRQWVREFIESYDAIGEMRPDMERYRKVVEAELAVMTDRANKMFPSQEVPSVVTFNTRREWLNAVGRFAASLDDMIAPSSGAALHGLPIKRVPKEAVISFLEANRASVFVTDASREEPDESEVSVSMNDPEPLYSEDYYYENARDRWRNDDDMRREFVKQWLDDNFDDKFSSGDAESIGRDAFDLSDEQWEEIKKGDLYPEVSDIRAYYYEDVIQYYEGSRWEDEFIEKLAQEEAEEDRSHVQYGTVSYNGIDYDVRLEFDGDRSYEVYVDDHHVGYYRTSSRAMDAMLEYIRDSSDSSSSGSFRWYQYTMPLAGLDESNYSEKLIVWKNPPDNVMPFRETSHWGYEDSNYVAHIRSFVGERKDGKKFLVLDELQSDWHKAIKKKLAKALTKEQAKAKALKLAGNIVRRTEIYLQERQDAVISAIEKSFVSGAELPVYRDHLLRFVARGSDGVDSIKALKEAMPRDIDVDTASIIFGMKSDTLDELVQVLRKADQDFFEMLKEKSTDVDSFKELLNFDASGRAAMAPSVRFHNLRQRATSSRSHTWHCLP